MPDGFVFGGVIMNGHETLEKFCHVAFMIITGLWKRLGVTDFCIGLCRLLFVLP